jgi:hypothetical protein
MSQEHLVDPEIKMISPQKKGKARKEGKLAHVNHQRQKNVSSKANYNSIG